MSAPMNMDTLHPAPSLLVSSGQNIKSEKNELPLDPEKLRLSRTETLGQINLWKCNKNKSADTINQKLSVGQMAS